MAALSSSELLEALNSDQREDRLVVSPLLDVDEQVSDAAIDFRLGTEFISLELARVDAIKSQPALGDDKTSKTKLKHEIDKVAVRHYRDFGDEFLVHPGQFVLGCSLEYLGIPRHLLGYIVGRSSWGRLGLVIETAMMVAPGFKGSITFELTNVGNVPIGIYPGTRIAQLVVHNVEGAEEGYAERKAAKYQMPTTPEFSRIYRDSDWELLEEYNSSIAGESSG